MLGRPPNCPSSRTETHCPLGSQPNPELARHRCAKCIGRRCSSHAELLGKLRRDRGLERLTCNRQPNRARRLVLAPGIPGFAHKPQIHLGGLWLANQACARWQRHMPQEPVVHPL